jgi:polar amino acid transport system substrate-binding protein
VHDSTLIHPLVGKNAEWAQYAAPITTEILPAPSVVWTRKGEADTIAAVDKVVQEWHRSGWLIATEKRLGITPANPYLVELQSQLKTASR